MSKTTFRNNIDFAAGTTVRILGTLQASGIPVLDGLTLTVNSDAVASSNQDPALALMGGDGGSEVIKTTLEQDSSADTFHVYMGGGAAGTTRKSPTVSIGHSIETNAGLDATLNLTGSTDAGVTKSASVVLLGEEQRLTVTSPADLRLSDSTATITLAAGALSATSLASVNLAPSATAQLGSNTSSGNTTIASGNGVSVIIPDNKANALQALEGANAYLNVRTSNGTEKISFGNSGTNPAYEFLGTGNIAVGGKITGLAAAAVNGDAVRYEQAVLKTDYSATGLLLIGNGSGSFTTVAAVNTSAGAGDAGKLPRLDSSGLIASNMLPTPASIRWAGSSSKGSANTNVVRFSAVDSGKTQGTGLTMTQSAANGDYISVTTAGVYAVSTTISPSVGGGWVTLKAAASLDNAGIDTNSIASDFSNGVNQPVNLSTKEYLAAGTKIWVASQQTPDGQSGLNTITVVGPLH